MKCRIFLLLSTIFMTLCLSAQSLVFHLPDGGMSSVTLPATFTISPSGDKLIIESSSTRVELPKNRILAIIYQAAKGDVNDDTQVDVADIATVIDIMAGKKDDPEPVTPEENAYTTCPDGNHPHMIDLGLPSGTKWACCNVGAGTPEEYGGYYTFDEAKTYNLPSLNQINELMDNTTHARITQNGVSGQKFKSKNNEGSVFFPYAGDVENGLLARVGSQGQFWSSTLLGEKEAYVLLINSGSTMKSWSKLGNGLSVRLVR